MRKRVNKWKKLRGLKREFYTPFDFAIVKKESDLDYLNLENGTIVRVEGKVSKDSQYVKCRKVNSDLVQEILISDLSKC